jgi:signal transduction histidine kinase
MPPDVPSRGPVRRLTGTLRFRITALATLAVAVILGLGGVALVATQRSQLTESVDDGLRAQARTLRAVVARGDRSSGLPGFGGEDFAARVLTPGGRVVAVSSDGIERDEGVRVHTLRVASPDGPRVIRVEASLEDVEESVAALTRSLVLAIPVVVLLLAGLVWWLVGRTLRPVESIRAEVARIGGRDLDRRVPVPRREDEIARLARTMNTMLDRIEDSHRRQERFVADAAHELRSPLTRMRSELEVDAAHPDAADAASTRESVLDETIALQRLVDDLLHLARSDGGAVPAVSVAVDLDDLVIRETRRLRAGARVTVDVGGVSAAQVMGDPEQLARAVRNLADNAVRHAATRVTFTLVETDSVARLTVADDGPGIPADARERIFDRFARLDEARTGDDGRTGLGLAITRDIVEAHGGTVAVDGAPPPGARFVVTLPLAGAPPR